MKFRRLEPFERDLRKLKPEHLAAFKKVVRDKFSPACDEWAAAVAARKSYVWPASLRVDELVNTSGIMELTWSFASPDGRATFKFTQVNGEWFCVWRRVGDHSIFRNP